MLSYSSPSTITCTLASLASAGSARESTFVSNTAGYDDAIVSITVTVQTGTAPAGDKAIYVYLYSGDTAGNYVHPVTGSDATIALTSPNNLSVPAAITCQSSAAGLNTIDYFIPSVASYFGGILPERWGLVFQNSTGMVLSATAANHAVSFVGVTFSTS